LTYATATYDTPLVADSTLAELALWLTEQAQEGTPPSLLGSWALTTNNTDAQRLTQAAQTGVVVLSLMSVGFVAVGCIGIWRWSAWTRQILVVPLVGNALLLLFIPVVEGDLTVAWLLAALGLLLVVLFMAAGRVNTLMGFLVALAAVLVIWETVKAGAAALNFAITTPEASWNYTRYATLEEALQALTDGTITAVWADRKELDELMPASDDPANRALPYPDLRYVSVESARNFTFPIEPAVPGRLNVAIRAADVTRYRNAAELIVTQVGVVQGAFADEKYLALPRETVWLELKIFNDLNLPHVQAIFEAFLQPARRNGDFLLVRILANAALYTWQEAALGFTFGVLLGLVLGTVFAHSALMERALLPYVVASQTVPILAIAPMVVIWLGASPTSVAVIAAYITFFPVTINTLRGLHSPDPLAIELMRSYAADWWAILWKLRFPSALPYIFAALKVSATASVVGAIIGELPSGIGDGLGRAILDFSSDYSLISTPKLWAAIITAAAVGAVFFLGITLVERVVLRRYVRSVD
jgi:NitT/TauT family transport system permease protein